MKFMKFTMNVCLSIALLSGIAAVNANAQQPNGRLSDDMIEKLVEHRLMRAGVMKANNITVFRYVARPPYSQRSTCRPPARSQS